MGKARTNKRGNGEGSIRQRLNGTWEGRLRGADGKQRSVYGPTRRAVQDKLRAAQRARDQGGDPLPADPKLSEFLERWLADIVRPSCRAKTVVYYEQTVRNHLAPTLGHRRLRALSPADVQTYLNAKAAAGLSPRTVAHHRAVLRAALNRALRWGLVERNAAALADPPRIEAKPIQPLTADQVRQFLDAVAADPLGPLFQVAIATGMRQRELFGLRWEDVDLTAATVTVRVALQNVGGTKTFVEPKTPHSRRTIPLPASGVRALRAQHARQNGQRLAAGSRWQEWGLVFTARYGTPLDGSNVGARLKKALQAADLPRQRFHDLRHCSASLLLQGGVGMRTIMGRLGHSQISLTMNTYTHLSPELERDAADALDRMIERPKPEGKHATRTDQATQDLG